MNELLMVMVVVLYAVIGSFIVIDVYFDFGLSQSVNSLGNKMTAITNLIIVLMPVIIMGLAIIVKDGF